MDLSIKQEFTSISTDHKGEVFFMIDNFTNLLNDDWGVEKIIRFTSKAIYDFGGLDDNGKYKLDKVYGGTDACNHTGNNLSSSDWQMKVGVNYRF
ncbi:MAG: hypothetical protein ACI9VO_000290 [Colwellia sp.]